MIISEADYRAMLARTAKRFKVTPDAVEKESPLHDDILAYCRSRGWYVVHSRMDRKTTTAQGVPDFVIAIPGGITLWIEAKAKRTKTTPEQLGVSVMLKHLGHRHAFVRSMQEFLEAVATPEAIPSEPIGTEPIPLKFYPSKRRLP